MVHSSHCGIISCNNTQVLEFSVACAQLSSAVLTVSMWDHRKMAKDVFLGEIHILSVLCR